jgi:hypothetical protein
MTQAAEKAQGAKVQSSDLLMTWFSDINYGGDSSDIYGSSGPCDAAGYKLSPGTFWWGNWGNILSSAGGTDACNAGEFYSQDNTRVWRGMLPTPSIGDVNDDVGMVRTYHE